MSLEEIPSHIEKSLDYNNCPRHIKPVGISITMTYFPLATIISETSIHFLNLLSCSRSGLERIAAHTE